MTVIASVAVSQNDTTTDKIFTIKRSIVSVLSDEKVSSDGSSFAHVPASSSESCDDCDSDDSSTYANVAFNIESSDERVEAVSVREVARVHFPSVDVVSEVRYRPRTNPSERRCLYYTPIELRRFKSEYRDERRAHRSARTRAVAAARLNQGRRSYSYTTSPISFLAKSAATLATSISSGTSEMITRAEREHRLRHSRECDGSLSKQYTNSLVDTLYLF